MDDQTDDLELAKMMADNSKYDPETKYGSIKASVFDLDDNGKVVYTSESKASEGRYIIAGSGFEVDDQTDDLELAKAIADDASAEEITTTPDFEYPQGALKGSVTDMDTGDRIYTAESKASEDHDSNYDYLENRDTQEDNVCAECGFVTSDNSEYLDHLNSHEE